MYLTEDMDYQESVIFIAVLLIFTNHRMTDACRGPGRRPPGTGRHPHKSGVPLKLGQRIPNISEKTVGASGPAEGKITRGDKRFKDLVTNVNPAIVFRAGANKQMSRRCEDRLNLLAINVQQNWPGVRLRVMQAWDGDDQHGDHSLHYEGRAVTLTTSDRDRKKYGMLARFAVEVGFDWVYYKSSHYIYASVIADDVQASFGGGCFPKDSDVTMGDGTVRKMADLKVGDEVLTLDRFTGERKTTDVILMMHKNTDTVYKFLKITAETNIASQSLQRRITLTTNHLVYKHDSNTSVRWQPKAVFAEEINVGDYIYFDSFEITNGTDFALAKVTALDVVKRRGVFAPLTAEGSITVNGVAASSYAVYDNEDISHALFYPLRLLWRWGLRWGDSLSIIKHTSGVHWYPRSIFHVASAILPKGVLNP